MAKKGYTVFISHSSKDRWIAQQVAAAIEQRGRPHKIKTVLSERDIEAGDDIAAWIRDEIIACDELLVLLSSFSIRRHWVILEIGVALGHKKHIAPITDKVTPKEVPDAIRQMSATDLNEFESYLRQLLRRASRSAARKKGIKS